MERLAESLDSFAMHKDFRLWLSTSSTEPFPISLLQRGVKIAFESEKELVQTLAEELGRRNNRWFDEVEFSLDLRVITLAMTML